MAISYLGVTVRAGWVTRLTTIRAVASRLVIFGVNLVAVVGFLVVFLKAWMKHFRLLLLFFLVYVILIPLC